MSAQDLEQRAPAIIDNAGKVASAPVVPASEVFRIAGGDTECEPNPTPERALEVLRDLRACYDEALCDKPAPVVDDAMVERALNAKAGNWPVRQLFSCEDEAREIMCIALTAALASAQRVQS